MTSQPQYQFEMYWILDGGCLRLVRPADHHQPLTGNQQQPDVIAMENK
jgi:hypothetical protein